jgi:hypothetical protein
MDNPMTSGSGDQILGNAQILGSLKPVPNLGQAVVPNLRQQVRFDYPYSEDFQATRSTSSRRVV